MIPRLSPSFGLREVLRAAALAWTPDARRQCIADWSRRVGIARVALFPRGRSAICAFLRALPGSSRTEVVLPAYTCVSVAEAVVRAGFAPVFVDVEPGMLEPTPESMAAAAGPSTRAIIATHLFGRRYPVARLRELLPPGIAILEDRAHEAPGGSADVSHPLEGDAAFWSFNHGKPLSAVFGAAIALPVGPIADGVEAASSVLGPRSLLGEAGMFAYAAASCVAFRSELFAVTRALTDPPGPCSALTRVHDPRNVTWPADADTQIARIAAGLIRVQRDDPGRRLRLHELYARRLESIAGVAIPPLPPGSVPSHANVLVERRDHLRRELRRGGIDTGVVFDYAVPDLPSMAPWRRGEAPHASRVAASILNLPVHRGVDELCAERIAESLVTAIDRGRRP